MCEWGMYLGLLEKQTRTCSPPVFINFETYFLLCSVTLPVNPKAKSQSSYSFLSFEDLLLKFALPPMLLLFTLLFPAHGVGYS